MALMLVLLASLGVPAWVTAVLVAGIMGLCLPAANRVARLVEKNQRRLTIAGAFSSWAAW